MDDLTALINKVKHRAVNNTNEVLNKGFEESKLIDGSFNVIASNIPFANTPVFDVAYFRIKDKNSPRLKSTKMIHNYYFAKSLDLLATGGLLAFVTSSGTLSSKGNEFIREFIATNANVIGAYKLPRSLFSDEGIAQIDSDLIILQKTEPKKTLSTWDRIFINPQNSSNFPEVDDFGIEAKSLFDRSVSISVLEHTTGKNQYGETIDIYDTNDLETYFLGLNRKIRTAFDERFKLSLFKENNQSQKNENENVNSSNINEVLRVQKKQSSIQSSMFDTGLFAQKIDCTIPVKDYYRFGTVVNQDNKLYTISAIDENRNAKLEILSISEKSEKLLKSAIIVRNAYLDLFDYERINQTPNNFLRGELNDFYDAHVTQFGFINSTILSSAIQYDTPHFIQLSGLELNENGNIVKSSIFREPTAITSVITDKVFNINVAIEKSLNKYGHADKTYITHVTHELRFLK